MTLPGEHYCENHQGNTSHYSNENCTVCKLQKKVIYNMSLTLTPKERLALAHEVMRGLSSKITGVDNITSPPNSRSPENVWEKWDNASDKTTQEAVNILNVIIETANKAKSILEGRLE